MITFKDYYDLERSMAFEGIFEEDLRLDKNEKKDLLGHCVTSYMFYEGFIAGEIYSVDVETLIKLEEGGMEDIGDIRYTSSKTAYIYSVAILPEWQGRGLSKILIAYHLGQLQISGFSQVVAHSTARAMDKVFKWFCFYFLQDGQHEKWYGTDRVARFCELQIKDNPYKQPDDYSCGVYSLKYLIDRKCGTNHPAEAIRIRLMPDKEVGTPCEAFEEYFTLNPVGIPKIGNNTELDNFPILVRHFDVDEGKTEHYSVIIGRYMQGEESMLNMFDPWIGEERTVSEKKFLDSWHSEKYGNRWGLRLEI